MAYLSKITLPSGTTYDIKDAEARAAIAAITGGDAVVFIGVSSTKLTNGGTEKPTIDSVEKTPKTGHIFFYGTSEFIWGSDSKWHELGSTSSLGSLAYKNNASGKVTPTGTVSKPTFTGSQSDVTITAKENTSGNYQPAGTISGAKFTGASMTSTGKYKPEGTVTVGTTTATPTVQPAASGTATYTPSGSLSGIAWSGSSMTSTGKFKPEGSVGTPTISVKTAGATGSFATGLAAAAPGATAPANPLVYYSVSGETLSLYQIGCNKGTAKTGDAAYQSSQPSFTGTEGNVSVSGTTTGSISNQGKFTGTGVRLVTSSITTPTGSGSFAGTEKDVSVSGTTTGSVSQGTFTGTKVQIGGTTTAAGTVSQPTFTGDEKTVTVS